jgi:hypothetical protein
MMPCRDDVRERIDWIMRELATAPLRPDQRALLADELIHQDRALVSAPDCEPFTALAEESSIWT